MFQPLRTQKRGFTLIELLVVIAIIGMLAALLLPAVQSARESGRRATCLNNVSQLALASLTFENSKERFPGYQEYVCVDSGGTRRTVSWAVMMLPYADGQSAYDVISDPTVTASSSDQRWAAANSFNKLFRCPTNPATSQSAPENSYVANGGYLPGFGGGPTPTVEKPGDGAFVDRTVNMVSGSTTELSSNNKVSMSNFRDGASQTILFSESLMAANWNVPFSKSASTFPSGANVICWLYLEGLNPPTPANTTLYTVPTTTATDTHKINGLLKQYNQPAACTNETLRPCSLHPGGVLAAFADKHAIFLKDSIDYRIYQQLLTSSSMNSSAPYRDFPIASKDYEN